MTHSTLHPPFCSVSFWPGAGGPAKEDLPSSFPSPFFALETKVAPLPHRGHIQGSAALLAITRDALGWGGRVDGPQASPRWQSRRFCRRFW